MVIWDHCRTWLQLSRDRVGARPHIRARGPLLPPLIAVINAVPVADDRHEIVAPTGRLRGSMVPLTV